MFKIFSTIVFFMFPFCNSELQIESYLDSHNFKAFKNIGLNKNIFSYKEINCNKFLTLNDQNESYVNYKNLVRYYLLYEEPPIRFYDYNNIPLNDNNTELNQYNTSLTLLLRYSLRYKYKDYNLIPTKVLSEFESLVEDHKNDYVVFLLYYLFKRKWGESKSLNLRFMEFVKSDTSRLSDFYLINYFAERNKIIMTGNQNKIQRKLFLEDSFMSLYLASSKFAYDRRLVDRYNLKTKTSSDYLNKDLKQIRSLGSFIDSVMMDVLEAQDLVFMKNNFQESLSFIDEKLANICKQEEYSRTDVYSNDLNLMRLLAIKLIKPSSYPTELNKFNLMLDFSDKIKMNQKELEETISYLEKLVLEEE